MLGNTYTNGSKGSGFDFELRVLKTLDMIAELVAAGGAVPGIQNLQSVTDIYNVTTNDIILNGGLLKSQDSSSYWNVEPIYLRHLQGSTTNLLILGVNDLSTNRGLNFPDADGTLVSTVGGVAADNTGNVPIDIPIVGCYTPTLSDSDNAFTFGEIAGHYYKFGNMIQVYSKFIATGTALSTTSQLLFSLPYTPVTSVKESIIASLVFTDGINQSIVKLGPAYESGGFLFFDITTASVPLTNYKAVIQVSYMIDPSLTICI